jgi:peptidyl-prolyl cis-trans isomerase D
MAIIGKIRSKSGWIVAVLGLALLTFTFDLWKDVFLSWFGKAPTSVGTVYGEDVDVIKFDALRRYQDERFQLLSGRSPQEKEVEFWYDEAWRRFTDSLVLAKEFDAIGISVSENELNAYFNATNGFKGLPDLVSFEGNPQNNGQPQQIIPSVFKDNTTNTYTAKSIAQGKEVIKKLKADKTAQGQKLWAIFQNEYKQLRAREKYMQLLAQGIYTTKLELEDRVESKSTTKNITYILKRYNEIPDEQVKVTDNELKAYFEAHKSDVKYKIEKANREVRVVSFNIVPSGKDSAVFNAEIAKIRNAWSKAKADSSFVMRNSDKAFYFNDKRATAVLEGNEKAQMGYQTFPADYELIFKTAKIDSIVGPYKSQGFMNISKVIGFTPSKIKARHIFVSTAGMDAKAAAPKKALADSLSKIANPKNFAQLVIKHSDDQRTKADSGLIKVPMNNNAPSENLISADLIVLGYDKLLADYCETGKVGEIKKVETPAGIHIIQVTERDENKLPLLVTIAKTFEPSKETYQNKEDEAYNLLTKLSDAVAKESTNEKKIEKFSQLVQEAKNYAQPISIEDDNISYTKNPNLYSFQEINTTNDLIELAYGGGSIGSFNEYPMLDGERYVIAMLSAIKPAGEPAFTDVKQAMEAELIKEKKTKLLKAQLAQSGKSVSEIVTKSGNTIQATVSDVSFSGGSGGELDNEPEIIGAIFGGLKDGASTLPIAGNNGVYVVQLNKTSKNPVAANYKTEKENLIRENQVAVDYRAIQGLRKLADIKDRRALVNLKLYKKD